MPYDNKYGEVRLEHGTVGDTEPVVVFRAQDKLLPDLLWVYMEMCTTAGSPQRHLDLIARTRADVMAWQADNYTQLPRSAGYKP